MSSRSPLTNLHAAVPVSHSTAAAPVDPVEVVRLVVSLASICASLSDRLDRLQAAHEALASRLS